MTISSARYELRDAAKNHAEQQQGQFDEPLKGAAHIR